MLCVCRLGFTHLIAALQQVLLHCNLSPLKYLYQLVLWLKRICAGSPFGQFLLLEVYQGALCSLMGAKRRTLANTEYHANLVSRNISLIVKAATAVPLYTATVSL